MFVYRFASQLISVLHSEAIHTAICIRLSTAEAHTSVCPNGVVTSWESICIKDANNTFQPASKWLMHHTARKVSRVRCQQVLRPMWGIDGSLFGWHRQQTACHMAVIIIKTPRSERWRWLRIEGWIYIRITHHAFTLPLHAHTVQLTASHNYHPQLAWHCFYNQII